MIDTPCLNQAIDLLIVHISPFENKTPYAIKATNHHNTRLDKKQ